LNKPVLPYSALGSQRSQRRLACLSQGENYLAIGDQDGNRTRPKGPFYESTFNSQRLAASAAATGAGGTVELRTAKDRVAKLFIYAPSRSISKTLSPRSKTKFGKLTRLTLAVVALTIPMASALLLTATWRVMRAEFHLRQLQMEIAHSQDTLARLRVDRAIGFCHSPLQFLAQILMREVVSSRCHDSTFAQCRRSRKDYRGHESISRIASRRSQAAEKLSQTWRFAKKSPLVSVAALWFNLRA